MAVPDRLTPRSRAGRNARGLLLTLHPRRRNSPPRPEDGFELGLSIEADLEEIGRALAAQEIPASLVVADFEHGVLTIERLARADRPYPARAALSVAA